MSLLVGRSCSDLYSHLALLSSIAPTIYSDTLSLGSPKFARPNVTMNNNYFYQTFNVHVSISGRYKFISNSSIDTYGYFYNSSVNPWSPLVNLIACDDDSGGSQQFLLAADLSLARNYVLLVTTSVVSKIGNFSIEASGASLITLNAFTPTTTTMITTTTSESFVALLSPFMSSWERDIIFTHEMSSAICRRLVKVIAAKGLQWERGIHRPVAQEDEVRSISCWLCENARQLRHTRPPDWSC